MKKFIVTGCNGYIGSHMCYQLRQEYPDCIILGIDKETKSHLNHLYNDFVLINLARDYPDYSSYSQIDCIFHFAALASVSEGEKYKYEYYMNNLASSLNMIELAKSHSIKNFIFSSTCAVYGKTSPTHALLNENQIKNPLSIYAKTKSMIEDVLIAAEESNSIRAGILRYFNAAGRNVKANLFEEHDPETHIIPILAKTNEIDIYGTDYDTIDGTCIRDYIHVIDVCQAHIKAYEYMENNKKGIICNIGTGEGYSVKQIVQKTEKILNKTIKKTVKSRRNGDVPYLVANTEKMKNVLTFEPQYDIISIIESMRV